MIQGKLGEYTGILTTTSESIGKYKTETLRIARKVCKQTEQQKEEISIGADLKQAVIDVFRENQELES